MTVAHPPFSFCLPGDWVNFENNKRKVMESERAATNLKRLKKIKSKVDPLWTFPRISYNN